jgi:hypothetical protein
MKVVELKCVDHLSNEHVLCFTLNCHHPKVLVAKELPEQMIQRLGQRTHKRFGGFMLGWIWGRGMILRLLPWWRIRQTIGGCRNCALALDGTGVGAPVVDMPRAARLGCDIAAVTITGGERLHQKGSVWRVPEYSGSEVANVFRPPEQASTRVSTRHARVRAPRFDMNGVLSGISLPVCSRC